MKDLDLKDAPVITITPLENEMRRQLNIIGEYVFSRKIPVDSIKNCSEELRGMVDTLLDMICKKRSVAMSEAEEILYPVLNREMDYIIRNEDSYQEWFGLVLLMQVT